MIHLPADHISAFVDIGYTVEKSLNASKALSEMTLGIFAIVEILCH